jgi:alpha-L-fucosidase
MPDLAWFEQAKLGLFIHWDHASQQGIEIGWPLVDRSIIAGGDGTAIDKVSIEQYQSSAATFNPVDWDATALAKLARRCGMQYAMFTTRHHAGYSMFHTEVSDFSIEHSPFQRDITREYVEAMRAEGLRVGIYYSLSDWHHPDYPRFEESDKPYPREEDQPYDKTKFRRSSPEAWERYINYVKAQLTELLTNYGQIDLIWFDGEWERTQEEWRAAELRDLIRSLQPDAIVSDRLPGQGDYVTPEQALPTGPIDGPWELALTMKDTWAYRPNDNTYKSPRTILRHLIEAVSAGGNLLLNVGPDGQGRLPGADVYRLKALGAWMATHGESVFGTSQADPRARFYGPLTATDSTLYAHLILQPTEEVIIRGVPAKRVRRVVLLGTERELEFDLMIEVHTESKRGGEALGELRIPAPDPTGALVDVIAVEFDGPMYPDHADS